MIEEYIKDRYEENRVFPRWEIVDHIENGGNGAVFSLKDKHDELSALKVTTLEKRVLSDIDKYKEVIQREIKILKELNPHPNILPIYEYEIIENDKYFVIYMRCDLAKYNLAKLQGEISTQKSKEILYKIANTMQEIHQRGYLHRDLKPQNILISQSDDIYISDFGSSKKDSASISISGTKIYFAPETLQKGHQTKQSDIYAYGLLAYQLVEGDIPFADEIDDRTHPNQLHQLLESNSIEYNRLQDKDLQNIITKSLSYHESDRYQSFAQIANLLKAKEQKEVHTMPIGSADIEMLRRGGKSKRDEIVEELMERLECGEDTILVNFNRVKLQSLIQVEYQKSCQDLINCMSDIYADITIIDSKDISNKLKELEKKVSNYIEYQEIILKLKSTLNCTTSEIVDNIQYYINKDLHNNKTTTNTKQNKDVWEDPETGLIWYTVPSEEEMNWEDAKEYARELRVDGRRWRLPTIEELSSIGNTKLYSYYDKSKNDYSSYKDWEEWEEANRKYKKRAKNVKEYYIKEPFLDKISEGVAFFWVWSSTEENTSSAWSVDFKYGHDGSSSKILDCYVLCVAESN